MRLAVFVGRQGVERVVPASGSTFEETDSALKLYRTLREEIAAFDEAVRRRTSVSEKTRKPLTVEMT